MTEETILTKSQRELARHALGLDGNRLRSFRNHFVAGRDHSDHPDWTAMVAVDLATVYPSPRGYGGADLFCLTKNGAQAALDAGESLDPEDFPQ